MSQFPEAPISNLALIEELYSRFLSDPGSVDPSWRYFFEGVEFSSYLYRQSAPAEGRSDLRIFELIQNYRRYGHLAANFNPLEANERGVPELDPEKLGFFTSELEQNFPSLGFCGKNEAPLKEILTALQNIYSNRIGYEYMDLGNPEMEKWIQARIEPEAFIQIGLEEKHFLLESLGLAESFERFMHARYVGQTRFSLEGAETMIPLLAELLEEGGKGGVEEVLIGMAHRGRLNVLAAILNKSYAAIFEEFEDDTTLSFAGNDDVKYHMGAVGQWACKSGKKLIVELAANPSHLESVDPVVLGEVKAKQIYKNDETKSRIVPVLIHGDASIAGQGVIYESLQLMNLPDYSVGGTIHLVVNNQIGYTTLPKEGRSTRYCTDIAKSFGAPVFHVNAEDPESCLFIAKLAMEIRQKFHCDVFIDLLCYRKYGHNEGDEPSFTQPLQYEKIRAKKSIRELYCDQLVAQGHAEKTLAETMETKFKEMLNAALAKAQEKIASKEKIDAPSSVSILEPFSSSVDAGVLKSVIDIFCTEPKGFNHHPKLQKWLSNRRASLSANIDWATGECLAFGSLLMDKVSIRLAGQDSQRGTFSQRHMVWIDTKTAEPFCPFKQIHFARFDVVNSPLTEYAGMGFEYGYSWKADQTLVLWEAQYGDFDNGAQIIIDQYLVSGEQKWNCPSSLTLLLPHGYEGAGPEHSSARLERFLQLAANANIQVVNATTPAQYFHLLRRQALRKIKRPLIVFTPKSLLRSPLCVSKLEDFTNGFFEEVLDDPKSLAQCNRLIFCSGKVFYDLLNARKNEDTALIRIEQLYPLDIDKIKKIQERYKGFKEVLWVQEEPENMGGWRFMQPHLEKIFGSVRYVGRPQNATTATGSSRKHKQEQQALIQQAFGE